MKFGLRCLISALVAGSIAGCAEEITGPSPEVEVLTPSLVCGDQLVTEVAIAGEALSPLAIDEATTEPHLAIPEVTLRRIEDLLGAGVSDAPVILPNDPLDPSNARVRWTSQSSMAFDVYPELDLKSGLYEVTVTNRNGRSATLQAAITVVPKPELQVVEPDLICLEQGMREVSLSGTGFVSVGDTLPTVTIGELKLPVDALSDCSDLPGPTAAQTCLTAKVTVPEGSIAPGAPALVLTNPSPAACHSEDEITLAVVPRPSLDSVEPDLICNAQGDRTLVLSGSDFIVLRDNGNTFPEVTIGTESVPVVDAEGCTEVEGTLLDTDICTSLTITVPSSLTLLGEQAVIVSNPDPAGCQSEETVTIALVLPPSVASVEPDLVCNAEGQRSLSISGSGFIVINDAAGDIFPAVTIGSESYQAQSADGCVSISGTLLSASACDQLTVILPQAEVGTGAHNVTVTNPNPAGCTSVESVTLEIVPEPTVSAAAPDLFCDDETGRTLTVTGSGFVAIRDAAGDIFPTVFFGTTPVIATAVSGSCTALDGSLLDAVSCDTLTVSLPSGTVPAGEYAIRVENPQPAGCDSNETDVFVFVAETPIIAAIDPLAVCSTEQPAEMTGTGTGFLRVANGAGFNEPVLLVDGAQAAATFAGCTAFTSTTASGEVCTSFTFAVPGGGFADGDHSVVLTNPAPADCADTTSFFVAPAPTIASVDPFRVCSLGDTFTVTGANFVDGQSILLDGSIAVPTAFGSDTLQTGTIVDGAVPAGLYDVSVTSGGVCESNVLVDALQVVDAPVLFFVDPPNVFNQIDMRVTLFVSGVSGAAPQVGIRATGTTDALTMLGDPVFNGSNRIFASLSANLVGAGDYDVVILDDPCATELINALHVTDTLTVHVSDIDPGFGAEGENTAVTLRSDLGTTPGGFDNFEQTPRVYFNPIGGGTSTELRSVQWLDDPERITGVVPDTIIDGDYQVLVINPDGGVGLLDTELFTVLDETDPPPFIANVNPGQVVDTTGQSVTIEGRNFPTVATDLAVEGRCRDPRAADPALTEILVNPTTTTPVSAAQIDTVWDMSGLNSFVCVVVVNNLANGSKAEFSAISVTNSSGNIATFFDSGRTMIEARRALASAAVQFNAQSRFLFAIGGDEGDDGANPVVRHSSVEATQVDAFGAVITDFATQRNSLPESRSFSAATVIDRFVYLAGGLVGADTGTVSGDVLRAYLLDPLESPEIRDLDLAASAVAGLPGGVWYYRVAAVMDDGSVVAADSNNPGGEGLASDPLVIQLPQLTNGVDLTLFWDHISGAVSYRVYRTTAPDDVAGNEVLLAEVGVRTDLGDLVPDGGTPLAIQSLLDDGLDNAAATETPMPLGSLGVWHSVGTLTTPRQGAALVAVPDPTDESRHYLYVIGGLDNTGVALDSHEHTIVVATGSASQVLDVGGFLVGAAVLPTDGAPARGARWQLGAVFFDSSKSTLVTGNDVFVYALPGIDENGANVNRVTSFLVDVADGADDGDGVDGDGSLSLPISESAPNPTFAGYGYVGNHDVIHLLGAQTGGPSASGQESFLASPAPDLNLWNAGSNLVEARYLHGSAAQSAFIFLLGGETGAPASNTVEQTNF